MTIKKIETFSNQYLSFVKITTDRGDVGWGQMSTYHADITTQIFHRQVAPYSIGLKLQEQPNFADHLQLIIEKEHKFPGSYLLRAIAGLDTAFPFAADLERQFLANDRLESDLKSLLDY